MDTVGVRATANQVGRWSAIALGFTLPIWTLADSVLMGVLITSWVATGGWREKLERIRDNPVAVSAILLFAFLLLGTLWGQGSFADRALSIKKYGELLLIPLLMTLAFDVRDRRRALYGFALGLLVTLGMSYALWFDLLTPGGLIKGSADNPFVFKKHITHNWLLAWGALLFGAFAWRAQDATWRWVWIALALLSIGNVLLMVQGRTGYVVVPALTVLFLQRLWGWKGTAAALVLVSCVFAGAYAVSTSFHVRIDRAVVGTQNWTPDVVSYDGISERLEFYTNTLELIRKHPVIGVGTGGFVTAYAEHVAPKGLPGANHPHNQYLLLLAQVGAVGVLLLLWLYVRQWKMAARLSEPEFRVLARGLVLAMAIGCLFNTFLIDHTEKLLYCWFSGLFYGQTSERPGVAPV